MNNSAGKSSVSGVEVKDLLKSQESRTRKLIEDVDKHIDERLATHSQTFDYELTKLQDLTREFYELVQQLVTTSKNLSS